MRSLRLAAGVALALALVGAASGCGSSAVVMTTKEIGSHGMVVLRGSPEKVFKASVAALEALGYEIAEEHPDTGLIVTKNRSVPDLVVGTPTSAVAVSYARRYTIEIRDGGGGTSRVTATPAIFENATDISQKPIWDLESSLGERELWKQLFAKIEQHL